MSQTKRKNNVTKVTTVTKQTGKNGTTVAKLTKSSGITQHKAPVSRSFQVKNKPANIKSTNSGDASIRVRHREYLYEIINTTGFGTDSFPVNPGMGVTFPWLSNISQNYERYSFNSLKFHYMPYCPTSVGGSVLMAVDFDSADASPSTKLNMMSYQGSTRSDCWDPVTISVSMKNLKDFSKERYIRQSTLASNLDIKTYDLGVFIIATDNGSNNGVGIGELYVEYDVTLMTPQLNPNFSTFAEFISGNTVANLAKPFLDITPTGSLDVVSVLAGGGIAIYKTGQFLMEMILTGGTITAVPPNLTVASTDGTSSLVFNSGFVNAGGTQSTVTWLINVLSLGAVYTLSLAGTATSYASYALRIASYATTAFGDPMCPVVNKKSCRKPRPGEVVSSTCVTCVSDEGADVKCEESEFKGLDCRIDHIGLGRKVPVKSRTLSEVRIIEKSFNLIHSDGFVIKKFIDGIPILLLCNKDGSIFDDFSIIDEQSDGFDDNFSFVSPHLNDASAKTLKKVQL